VATLQATGPLLTVLQGQPTPTPTPAPTPTPTPVPTPTPTPEPAPEPTKATVNASATGVGLQSLETLPTLTASGGGFSGQLAVQAVTFDQPSPTPTPEPDGDLQVVVSVIKSNRGILASVTVKGPESIPVALTWPGTRGLLPFQALVNGGAVWGRLSGVTSGQVVTVTAAQGLHQGHGEGVVP
jgi:hypothetical protein